MTQFAPTTTSKRIVILANARTYIPRAMPDDRGLAQKHALRLQKNGYPIGVGHDWGVVSGMTEFLNRT
jgi:hypothetical protein